MVKNDPSHQINTIRIEGIRVDSSDKAVSYNDEAIDFVAQSKATLRLFGSGFTEQMVIAFTEESNDRGGACLGASGGQFLVRKEGLSDHTVLVDIVVPVAGKTPYHICAKYRDPPMTEKVWAFYFLI